MINKVILMGRLTADPNFSQTQNGTAYCRFTVAVNRNFADKSTGERQADFINVVAWKQTAEFINKYFSKGKMIIVEGTLRNDNYTDSNNVKHYSYNVVADNVSFGESKSASGNNNNSYPVPQNNYSQNNSAPQNNAPAQNFNSAPADNTGMSVGNLSDFEEVLGENDLPF